MGFRVWGLGFAAVLRELPQCMEESAAGLAVPDAHVPRVRVLQLHMMVVLGNSGLRGGVSG